MKISSTFHIPVILVSQGDGWIMFYQLYELIYGFTQYTLKEKLDYK